MEIQLQEILSKGLGSLNVNSTLENPIESLGSFNGNLTLTHPTKSVGSFSRNSTSSCVVKAIVKGHALMAVVDTGSDVTIISDRKYQE